MALPNSLDRDLLYFFVLGPSKGETVLLRIPPDQWVIIDSFKCNAQPAAAQVVSRYGGSVACIVLTHPHQDHYPGIVGLIDEHPGAILACVHPRPRPQPAAPGPDPMNLLSEGAKPTYDRIAQEWDLTPARRWETFRHQSSTIGDAQITSLHPMRPVPYQQWGQNLNDVSSAMLVRWHNVTLLLGADVTNTQWPGIELAFPNLGRHTAMKVPHHGSNEAIHTAFGNGLAERCWIVTPFRPQGLPRAIDGDGLATILSFVARVDVTALPFSHNSEGQDPCLTTREQIRDNNHPVQENRAAGAPTLDRQVVIGFDQAGNIRARHYGPGSAHVTRTPGANSHLVVHAVGHEVILESVESIARIRLQAHSHILLDRLAREITEVAERSGSVVRGPIPLPTRVERYTVLRSPHIDRKSREQFEIRTHKRLIDIHKLTRETVDALNKDLSIPPGVDVSIRMLDLPDR